MSSAVEKTCDFFVGIVVFLSISLVNTPPNVSIPNDSGVTSRSNTSFTSPTSFIYAFYNLMKIIFKKFKNKINNVESFNAFFYLGIFINLFPVLPSGNFFNNWLLLMIHLPLAFYIASNKENLGYFKKL